jgi:hypothetical protein
MERERITQIGPVCRFGPGGDYATTWPVDWEEPANQPKTVFGRLLNVLVGMIESLRGDGGYEIDGPTDVGESLEIIEQGMTSYVSKSRRIADTPAGSAIKHNRWICDQPGLFADDWRAGAAGKHKQNHGIRAHRAAAKKGACFAPAEGRTLFDADSKSAKTA